MPLRVTQPFDDHAVGDLITDASKVAEITGSDKMLFVIPICDPVNPTSPAPVAPSTPSAPASKTSKE